MKTKALSLFVLVFVLILSSCSPFAIVSSSGEQPAPEVEALPVAAPEEDNLIAVERVEVQVGVGSPIPVEIVASGTWPDLCAQIAEVKSEIDGFEIDVTLLASKSESCPPDHLGLPFRLALPLNIVEMPDGVYTITVNGTSTTFELPISQ